MDHQIKGTENIQGGFDITDFSGHQIYTQPTIQGGLDACYQSRNALQRDSILAGFRMHQVRYAVRPVFESRTV